jgi:anti-anti-sigma factor
MEAEPQRMPSAQPTASVPRVEVHVAEEFDVNTVPRLHALLDEALALNPRELVVDLEDCPLVDAAAIGLLLDVHRRAWRAGGVLTLRSPSARLRRNLRLARVDAVLRVTPLEAKPDTDPATDGLARDHR